MVHDSKRARPPLQALRYGCIAWVALALAAAGCSKKDETPLAPAASALASSAPAARVVALPHRPEEHDAQSRHARREEREGTSRTDTTAAAGNAGLDVFPKDLSQSRGLVRIDLTTFATHTFGTDDDAAQTKRAHVARGDGR